MASPLTRNTFSGIVASMKSITPIETAMAKKGFPDVSKALLVKLLLGEKLNISADASEFEVVKAACKHYCPNMDEATI
eukprot:10246877-Lingulodinium_polyedra.AAC.1